MEPVYLDNAATTRHKPEAVYAAVESYMRRIGTSSGRGTYALALEAERVVFEARSVVCRLFGIKDVKRLVFTHNATESLNLAVKGLLKPGDHVVISSLEHNALWRPLKGLERRLGIELTVAWADRTGWLDPGAISAAMRPNTRLVAVTHLSNVVGSILPLAEIGRAAREAGALFLVDAAQSAGVLPIDVDELGIDLLAFTGHKALFGPPGTGGLYLREHADRGGQALDLVPLKEGGTGSESALDHQPHHLPDRYEAGTLNTWGLAGLAAGVKFVLDTGPDQITRHEMDLTGYLRSRLDRLGGVVVYGPKADGLAVSVVSFAVRGTDPTDVAYRLDREHGIMVRAGLHCAPLAHRTIGTLDVGTVRASVCYLNTPEDIDRLVEAVASIARGR